MYYDFKVKIPEGTKKICFKKVKSAVYVNYEYDRVYMPERQYTNVKRTTIGKVCEDDESMMYPNPNFIKYFPDTVLPTDDENYERSLCLRIGTYLVLEKLVKESNIKKILDQIYDERGTGLFLDLAAYLITTSDNASQHYPDYAYNHPLFTEENKIYSDSTISRFIHEMSTEDSVKFQNEWNRNRNHSEKIYISYDSTNKHCEAGDIEFVEIGHFKDGSQLPIVNISMAYDTSNREPLFYEEYPGSIVDVSQLQFMLEKATDYGYQNAAFILDRGYFSKPNIRYMDSHGYEFVIMLKGMKSLVKEMVIQVKGTFEEKRSSYISRYQVYGTSLTRYLFASDEKDRYIHIFYNSEKAASEKDHIQSKIDGMAKLLKKMEGTEYKLDANYLKYFSPEYKDGYFVCAKERLNVIDEELSLCGYFCIVTSEKMTATEAIELYKSRDYSEKLFASDKSFLGSKSMRIQSSSSFSGKILIEFAALILRNRFYTKLKDETEKMVEKPNFMNVPSAIRELEKIEMIKGSAGVYRLSHAVTANQKTILKAFGIDASYVKSKAAEIRDRFNPNVTTVKLVRQ